MKSDPYSMLGPREIYNEKRNNITRIIPCSLYALGNNILYYHVTLICTEDIIDNTQS